VATQAKNFSSLSMTGSCAYSAGKKVVVSSEFYEGPFGLVPVYLTRPIRDSIASAPLVLVHLVGGPGDSVFHDPKTSQLGRFNARIADEEGVISMIPGYLGTSTRTLHPRPDIDPALEEISSLLRQLQQQRAAAPVCVIGASLGGYLAGALQRRFPQVPMLALNPLIQPVSRMVAEGERIEGKHLWYQEVREHELRDGRAVFVRKEMVLVTDRISFFFGKHADDGLADMIGGGGRKLTVAYSPADPRIGVDGIPDLAKRAPLVKIVPVNPVGHEVADVENFWAYRPVIEAFLQRCMSGGRDWAGKQRG
jgi:pimeloyl-ACP methyl ester carboxylesterase